MKVRFEHVISAPLEQVLEAYRDDTFYIEKLKNSGALSVEILEKEEMPGGKLRKKVKATEPSRIPQPFRRAEVDEFIDDNVLDPETGTLVWKVTPSMAADKFFLSGVLEFHGDGGSTRMVFNTELEVKIPFVGNKVEKIGLAKTEEEVETQVAFIKKWMQEH
ncbi:MAG: DUF2505 domain-containing protein [Deltaproteobacteria bacterium]|nr:DUF2505 domain-containing protein [Deltaproteobacteria bacterium]